MFVCDYLDRHYVRWQLSIDDMVEEVNEKHMGPWGEACQCDGVLNTPLTPFIEKVITHFYCPMPRVNSGFPLAWKVRELIWSGESLGILLMLSEK